MQEKIAVATSSGVTGELKRASLEMKSQTLRSHQPVWFTMDRGTVKANALTFISANSTLTFRGKVRVHMIKQAKDDNAEKKPPKAEAEAPTVVPPLPEATGPVSASTGAMPAVSQ